MVRQIGTAKTGQGLEDARYQKALLHRDADAGINTEE